jgi:hypothetical protein
MYPVVMRQVEAADPAATPITDTDQARKESEE